MYMRFFGLKQEPFSLAPDPRYLYMSKRHREALAHLLYGVGGGGGFVLLSGEIGAGKTTVCRCFLEQIPKRCNVAYIFNPKLTVLELVKSICDEFHIPPPKARGPATVKTYVDALNDFLLRTHAVGQNNVLIIDEAQQLSAEVLEQLRLLTNLETNERKLLQIVLIGQPELRTMLERPDLEQLAQRVIARFHLKALTAKETEHYIRHRLSVAGMTRAIPFDRKALQRVHEISRGVPRRINLLCDRVMLGAYAHGRHAIDDAMVEKAGREVFGRMPNSTPPDRAPSMRGTGVGIVIGAGLAVAVLAAFALYSGWRQGSAPTTAVAAGNPAQVAASASAPASAAPASAAATAPSAASAQPSAATSTPATPARASTASAAAAKPAAVAHRTSTTASAPH